MVLPKTLPRLVGPRTLNGRKGPPLRVRSLPAFLAAKLRGREWRLCREQTLFDNPVSARIVVNDAG